MDTDKARELYVAYAPAMAYLCVRSRDGAEGIGSAFHVGDGVFVTARHVVDQVEIIEIASTERQFVNGSSQRVADSRRSSPGAMQLLAGPFFHPDDRVDVAVFVTDHANQPAVPLGSHLDDWLGTELVLTSAVVMGYPPIPMSKTPLLLAARAEINTIVDPYHAPHPHFVLSAMSRGGFSGGLALSEYGFALGVITQSFLRNGEAAELGFFSVLSIEPIYQCLSSHKVLPECQRHSWSETEIWDHVDHYFSESGSHAITLSAEYVESGALVSGLERDNSFSMRVQSSRPAVAELALREVLEIASAWEDTVLVADGAEIEVSWPSIPPKCPTLLESRDARLRVAERLLALMSAAGEVLRKHGYRDFGTLEAPAEEGW